MYNEELTVLNSLANLNRSTGKETFFEALLVFIPHTVDYETLF